MVDARVEVVEAQNILSQITCMTSDGGRLIMIIPRHQSRICGIL